jgi:hypothetical protein
LSQGQLFRLELSTTRRQKKNNKILAFSLIFCYFRFVS